MDPFIVALIITKVLLINTKNLMQAVEKVKANDGKITSDELPGIIFEMAIKSLDDLGEVNLSGLLGAKK